MVAKVECLPITHDNDNHGIVKAQVCRVITDLHGITRQRRISLGYISHVELETAKQIISDVRAKNESEDIVASFMVYL